MNWFYNLFITTSVAHSVIIYSLIISVGIMLGKIKVYGISLGVAFVLFTGIVFGHLGIVVSPEVVEFCRETGLLIFVYTIGLQLGPGFFSSLKKEGLTLNMLAAALVLCGAITTYIIHICGHIPMPVAVGIMSGAVTNTPGLGAAQQAIKDIVAQNPTLKFPSLGLGYAVAYPFGVLGIILTMLLLKTFFKVNVKEEDKKYLSMRETNKLLPQKVSVVLKNKQLFNQSMESVNNILNTHMVVSRLMHDGKIFTPSADTILHENDILLIVAPKRHIEKLVQGLGELSEIDLYKHPSDLVSRRILVTKKNIIGKTLEELDVANRFNTRITRVYRTNIEFVPESGTSLKFGDRLTVVGEEEGVEMVSKELGNSMKRLNEPNLVPILFGIVLGVIFGSLPVYIPGMPVPLKLGLAGGPLIIALLISRFSGKLMITSYVTESANLMLRELGIMFFLASVGLTAGRTFVNTLLTGDGVLWMEYGAIITLVPLVLVSLFAKLVLKRNYLEIIGLLAGASTDPPALAFANATSGSDVPALTYATVYPLTTFLRIMIAQMMVLFFT
ncbi:MAG: putative transporter [Ignavibacteriaceae bacterium]|nr:putative transporter [Ignavibacteriaceae bacterium]